MNSFYVASNALISRLLIQEGWCETNSLLFLRSITLGFLRDSCTIFLEMMGCFG
jgi:hypothetical protein